MQSFDFGIGSPIENFAYCDVFCGDELTKNKNVKVHWSKIMMSYYHFLCCYQVTFAQLSAVGEANYSKGKQQFRRELQ